MLTRLTIRDFAVVAAAELEFGTGMTVISGETGAGKSLLVDALGFLSGQRADSGMVRHGAERAELTAEFALSDTAQALAWLRAGDFDDSGSDNDSCQLRRTLRADGGSRAWINGRPATLGQLAELAALLIEIHGQHEHQALLSKPRQLALLDAYGQHREASVAVRTAADAWSSLLRERDALLRAGDVSDRVDLLEHQLRELERETLEPAAVAEMFATHRRHANAASLIERCDDALARLEGDEGPAVLQTLRQLHAGLSRAQADEPRFADAGAMLETAAIQVEETTRLLQRIREELDLDPSRFEALEQRMTRLHELARKHRATPETLIEVRTSIATELDGLRHAGERLTALDADIGAARARWQAAAAALTRARQTAAAQLSTTTSTLIGELGMGSGRFEVALESSDSDRPDPQGAERAEFLIAANSGQPPRPLRKTASGGELSRVSLAIEVAALGHDAVPTMIFDEVDSGIGGAVADIVGQTLRKLGTARQVLCVTHLPQVAAQGHAHYRVSKAEHAGATHTAVQKLTAAQRQDELARMLGGVEVSKEAFAAAKRLLQAAAS